VRALCGEIQQKIRFAGSTVNPEQRRKDRNLRVKVCYLVAAGIMPEAWLRDATEAAKRRTQKKGRDAGYWYTCLKEGAKERGEGIEKLLATCERCIPAAVLTGDAADQAAADEPAH
jgi:hypothetical protein